MSWMTTMFSCRHFAVARASTSSRAAISLFDE